MLTILPADPCSIKVALNIEIDLPAVAAIGLDDGKAVGTGGLAWGGGRCWLWFATVDTKPHYARPVLQMARTMLRKARQLGEPAVYTIRDPNFDTSSRLLKLTGFEFYGVEDDNEVYRCAL